MDWGWGRFSVIISIVFLFLSQTIFAFEFLGDHNIPSLLQVEGTTFGGLSGLTYNPLNESFIAVSDDRSRWSPARIYDLKIHWTGQRLEVQPQGVMTFQRSDGSYFPSRTIDAEGIVYDQKWKRYFVSSEGDLKTQPPVPPTIFVMNEDGQVLDELHIPNKFLPNKEGPQNQGIIDNGAFEGLTLTPDGQYLIAMVESPLIQDTDGDSSVTYSKNRGLVYKIHEDGTVHFFKEFIYPLSQISKLPEGASFGGVGVSEILALSENQILVLERGGYALDGQNDSWLTTAQLFQMDWMKAEDVSNQEGLSGVEVKIPEKKFIFDFSKTLDQLTTGYQTLDNLEGMFFGPPLPTGEPTLLLMSDDNFNSKQRTQFLLFKL